jgi:hypothetical protein
MKAQLHIKRALSSMTTNSAPRMCVEMLWLTTCFARSVMSNSLHVASACSFLLAEHAAVGARHELGRYSLAGVNMSQPKYRQTYAQVSRDLG